MITFFRVQVYIAGSEENNLKFKILTTKFASKKIKKVEKMKKCLKLAFFLKILMSWRWKIIGVGYLFIPFPLSNKF